MKFDRWSHAGAPSDAELAQIFRGIDETMNDVLRRDARNNPNALEPPPKVTAQGTGWIEPAPLSPPPGQDVIERMVNAALPHSPKAKEK